MFWNRVRLTGPVPSSRSSDLGACGIVDEPADALERQLDLRHRRSEREAQGLAGARAAHAAPLARLDVEEVARHGDDLSIERGAAEAHAVRDRGRPGPRP